MVKDPVQTSPEAPGLRVKVEVAQLGQETSVEATDEAGTARQQARAGETLVIQISDEEHS